jgi:single-stranded-DNA-specific exonuclease
MGDRRAFEFRLKPFLDLVALGTVADMVPLQNENRIFVHYGLKRFKASTNPGIRALVKVACGDADEITSEDVSFKLAPRINASGRLGSAEVPFDLLQGEDVSRCLEWATHLDELNRERQRLERTLYAEAEELVASRSSSDNVWVLYREHWHVGVVGIVAGKLAGKYGRPVVVLGRQGEFARGSGRGIHSVNWMELLEKSNAFLQHWGGHPAAVGVTLLPEKIKEWEAHLNRYLELKFPLGLPEKEWVIADTLALSDLTPSLVQDIERLQPFGYGNPAPIFEILEVPLTSFEYFGDGRSHVRCRWNGPLPLSIVGWGMGKRFRENFFGDTTVRMAATLGWSTWNRERQLQLQCLDLKQRSPQS